MLVEVGRCDERLAGHAPVAGVVAEAQADAVGFRETPAEVAAERAVEEAIVRSLAGSFKIGRRGRIIKTANQPARSEEHTSELQSQSNLVCRLLLEKKKTEPAAIVVTETVRSPPT